MTPTDPSPPQKSRRLAGKRRGRRLLIGLAAAAVAVLLLYIVGANLFLSSARVQRLVSPNPHKLLVTWERAWTVWPGRIHLTGVEIRGQNRRLQWWAALDRTRVSVDLPALAWRTFHARSIAGDGLEFRLRLRLPAGGTPPTGPDGRPLTPDIPGLDNPPHPPPEATGDPRRPEERPPGWRIHLDRIALEGLREIWVDRYRLAGESGELRGAMELQVRGPLTVEQAEIELREGRMKRGGEELLEGVGLDLGVRLDTFHPKREKGLAFLRHVSGDLRLDTHTDSIGFLDPLIRRVPGLTLDSGGALTVDARIDHGQPAAGSRFELVPEGLQVAYHGFRADGRGRVQGEIRGAGDAGLRTVVEAVFERFDLRRESGEVATEAPTLDARTLARRALAGRGVSGRGLTVRATVQGLRLDRPPPPPTVEVDLAELEIPDLTVYNALLPEDLGLLLVSGHGSFGAHAVLDAGGGTGRGELTFTARELEARGGRGSQARPFESRGEVEVQLEIPAFDLAERTFETGDGRVGVSDLEVAAESEALRWRTRLDRLDVELDPAAFRRRTVHAQRLTGRGLTLELDRPAGESDADPRRTQARRGPETSGDRDGWRLRLEQVAIEEIRELRFERYRLQGRGRLAGDLDLQLGGPLAAPKVLLEMDKARILEDKVEKGNPRTETLLPRLDLRTELTFEELLPARVGPAFLAHASGTLHLRTHSDSLAVVNRFLTRAPELRLDGNGELTLDLVLERGTVVRGSRLTTVGELDLRFLDYEARGSGRLTGSVEPGPRGTGRQTVLEADLGRFDLSWRGGPQKYVRGTGLDLVVTAPVLFLGAPFEMPELEVEIDLPESEVPDFTVYNPMLPAGADLRLTAGRGSLAGHASFDTASATGQAEMTLHATGLSARYGTTDLTGDFQLRTRIPRMQLRERRFDLAGSRMDIERAVVAGEPMEDAWWMRVELPRARLELGEAPSLDARVRAALRDSSPLTAYLESKKKILRWVDRALTVKDVEMAGDLRAQPGLYRLGDLTVTGRHLEILGELRVGERQHAGLFHLELGPLSVGFEMVNGQRDLKVFGSREWFRAKRTQW